MAKTYLAEKAQLDAQNQTLIAIGSDITEINGKIAGVDLESVDVFVMDFQYDNVTITSGGYDSVKRIITT